jgi:sec-independent protein translocase protein TatC
MSENPELTIWEHFEELSSRFRRIVMAIIVVMMIVMSLPSDPSTIFKLNFSDYQPFISYLMEIIQENLLPEGVTLIAFNWLDSFYIYMVISFVISCVICLPYIAAQLYGFVSPAIYEEERKTLFTFVFSFIILFSLGVVYAYYVIIPATFTILYRFVNQARVMPFYSVKDFFEVITFGLFGTGLFYTFPLDIYLLVRIDLIRVEDLKKVRKELLIGMLIITAILTPDPTPVSMLLMTIPFFILYELTIIILGWIMKDKPDHVVEAGRQKSIELIAKNQQSKPEE